MANPIYDSDAVDFSVDTSELESGKLDDDGAAIISPGSSNLVDAGDGYGGTMIVEEEGECGSDVEHEMEACADKLSMVRSFPSLLESAKKEDVELEDGECNDDDDDNDKKVTERADLVAHKTKRDTMTDTTIKPAKQGVCVHFLKQKCTWGDNCRYFHPGSRTSIGNYVLFEELEQARRDKRPSATGQRQVGAPNVHSPGKTTNLRRVPVHLRLGEVEMRSAGRVTSAPHGLNTVTPNGFVPMPFTLPKQETAWEAGLRKVSDAQSSVQKRRERAEDMQLGISNDAEEIYPSALAKPMLPLTTAVPISSPESSKISDSLSASIYAGSPNKVPNLLVRVPMFSEAAGNLTDRQAQFSPDRFAGQRNSTTYDELTISISNRDNGKTGARRASPAGNLSDLHNDDMHARGGRHPHTDHSRPSALPRRHGPAITNSETIEFPPPPVHLLHSSNGPLSSDQQRRYERQLSHYFPSRKYYANVDGKPHDDFKDGLDNKTHPSTRFGGNNDSGNFDRQLMPRSDDFEIHRPFRINPSVPNLVADELADPSDDSRSMLNRNNSSNNVNSGNDLPDAAVKKEESALEVARRRHLERRRQPHPQAQQASGPQRKHRGASRNSSGKMSNISSSSREHSLDVVSDSEDKSLQRHKKDHRIVVPADDTERNSRASSDVGKSNGARVANNGSMLLLVPADDDAVVENSGSRKPAFSPVSTSNELSSDSANMPTTLRKRSNRSPTTNAQSPTSSLSLATATTQLSENRKRTMQQQQLSPSPTTTAKAKTMPSNDRTAVKVKRQPVKLTINNSKRVKSLSGAVFDEDDDGHDNDDDDDSYDGKQRQTVNIGDDCYESIGNSDDETHVAASTKMTGGLETNCTRQPPPAKAAAISPHDREELLRQLRVIEEEIAAKRQRANAASTTTSAATAK